VPSARALCGTGSACIIHLSLLIVIIAATILSWRSERREPSIRSSQAIWLFHHHGPTAPRRNRSNFPRLQVSYSVWINCQWVAAKWLTHWLGLCFVISCSMLATDCLNPAVSLPLSSCSCIWCKGFITSIVLLSTVLSTLVALGLHSS